MSSDKFQWEKTENILSVCMCLSSVGSSRSERKKGTERQTTTKSPKTNDAIGIFRLMRNET